jgi:CBS-domain-containing membrane protein
LVEAAGLMRELDVGSLPVCDNGDLTGMLTDRDIVVRGVADGLDPTRAHVSQVMSGAVEAIAADADVENAVQIMEQRQIRRLPVLDNAKRLIGIVSIGDIAISSNPAFGGTALREVSEPDEPSSRRRRLATQSQPPPAPRVSPGRRQPKSRGQLSGSTSRRSTQKRKRGSAKRTRRR